MIPFTVQWQRAAIRELDAGNVVEVLLEEHNWFVQRHPPPNTKPSEMHQVIP